jgi:hypothetical protein
VQPGAVGERHALAIVHVKTFQLVPLMVEDDPTICQDTIDIHSQ